MSTADVIGLICFYAGVVLVLALSLAALRMSRPQDRVHFLTPTTTLGTPLIGLGLVLQNGWTLTSAQIAVICVLLMIAGPVLGAATVRVASQLDGTISPESPE